MTYLELYQTMKRQVSPLFPIKYGDIFGIIIKKIVFPHLSDMRISPFGINAACERILYDLAFEEFVESDPLIQRLP